MAVSDVTRNTLLKSLEISNNDIQTDPQAIPDLVVVYGFAGWGIGTPYVGDPSDPVEDEKKRKAAVEAADVIVHPGGSAPVPPGGIWVRIYLNPYLTDFIEVPENAVLYQKSNEDTGNISMGGSYFWINADANVKHGRKGVIEPIEMKASTFRSNVAQKHPDQSQLGSQNSTTRQAPGARGARAAPGAYCGYPEGTEWYTTDIGVSCPYSECCAGPG